jgi:hypothetical protein
MREQLHRLLAASDFVLKSDITWESTSGLVTCGFFFRSEENLDVGKQYIYEMIALSVPLRRVHPGVKDGSLNSEALTKLNELTIKELKEDKEEKEENIDPRWDKLKQLLTDK